MSTDHDFMLAVRDGDVDKLGLLFEKYHNYLYNFFLQQTGNRETSEDLVQDVFFRMLKYRHTYRGEGKFTTWMFSVAHSAKIEHYRKQKHKHRSIKDANQLTSEDPSPEAQAEQKNHTALLKKALARLSEEKREVLILSRFENMKYDEIASIMGCKVGTIKARVHWALKDLTQIYQELTGGVTI